MASAKSPSHQFFGFKIVGDSYELLSFLFYEIFIIEEYFFNSSKKNPTVYDCGSNIGFSVLYFKWLYPEAVIYAFEPQPSAFSLLQMNVANNNLQSVFLHNWALSDREGAVDFFQPTGKVSLMASTLQERMNSNKISVKCRPLSQWVTYSGIDLLKMDVEGAEKEIIAELDRSGKLNCFERIIIEYHHKIGAHKSVLSEFLRTLEKNGREYQVKAEYSDINTFQDIIIDSYRPADK